jgi:hypothetical protein
MHTRSEPALILAITLLNAYSFGANCVERFVNYQTWNLIPTAAFQAYHRAQQPLIQVFVVAPMALGIVLQVWLISNLPAGIDPVLAWVMVVASAVGGLSTITLQLPIHATFNRGGYTPALMRKLLHTDWIRKAADIVRLAATAMILHRLLMVH